MAFQGWCCFATSTESQNGAAEPFEGQSIVQLNNAPDEPDEVAVGPVSPRKSQGRVKATGQVIVEVHRLHKESPHAQKHRHERSISHESSGVLSPRARQLGHEEHPTSAHHHEAGSLASSPAKPEDLHLDDKAEQPAEHLSEEERDTIMPLHRELTMLPTSSPARTPRGMDSRQYDCSAQGTPSDISNSSTKPDMLPSPRGDASKAAGSYSGFNTGQPAVSPAHTPMPMVRVTAADILTGAVNTQGLINVQRHGLSPFLAGVTAYSVPANNMSASPSHHTMNHSLGNHAPSSYLSVLTSNSAQGTPLPVGDGNLDMAAMPSPRSTTSHHSCTTPAATPTHPPSLQAFPPNSAPAMQPTHHRSYSASTQASRTVSSTSPSSMGYTTTPTSRAPPRAVTPGSRSNLAPGQFGASGSTKTASSTGAVTGHEGPDHPVYHHHHTSSASSIPQYNYTQAQSPRSSAPNSRLDATFDAAATAAQRLAQQAYLSSARAQTALSRHANAAARQQRQQQQSLSNPYGFAPVLTMSAHALAKATQGHGSLGQQGSLNNNSVRSTGSSRRSGAVQQGSRAVTNTRPYQTSVKVGSASSRVALSSLLSRGSNLSTTSTDRNSLLSTGMDFRPRWR